MQFYWSSHVKSMRIKAYIINTPYRFGFYNIEFSGTYTNLITVIAEWHLLIAVAYIAGVTS